MEAQKPENNQIPDESYLHLLHKVNFLPVFIMGDHRSGTTLLYKLLMATQCFNFVSAYHIIKYDEILFNYVNRTENQARKELDELFKSLELKDRVIDSVEVTPDLPEEYGFILGKAGYDPPQVSPGSLALFTELCKKVQFGSDLDKPLLLKNPWDFSNFMYVKSVLPEAKFIFIHRHPIYAINSKLKAARSILTTKNAYIALLSQKYTQIFNRPVQRFIYQMLYSSYFDLGLRRVTSQAALATNYFLHNVDALPITDHISIRYEDLCENPEKTVLMVLGFLGLKQRSALAYESLIEPRSPQLLPEVAQSYDDIYQKLQLYFAYHGYDA